MHMYVVLISNSNTYTYICIHIYTHSFIQLYKTKQTTKYTLPWLAYCYFHNGDYKQALGEITDASS